MKNILTCVILHTTNEKENTWKVIKINMFEIRWRWGEIFATNQIGNQEKELSQFIPNNNNTLEKRNFPNWDEKSYRRIA
jgi:hypothetical protein